MNKLKIRDNRYNIMFCLKYKLKYAYKKLCMKPRYQLTVNNEKLTVIDMLFIVNSKLLIDLVRWMSGRSQLTANESFPKRTAGSNPALTEKNLRGTTQVFLFFSIGYIL